MSFSCYEQVPPLRFAPVGMTQVYAHHLFLPGEAGEVAR